MSITILELDKDDLLTCLCRSGDTNFHSKQRQLMGKALYSENWHQEIKDFYEHITLQLLHENSCKIAGINQVDITREYVAECLSLK